LEYEGVCGEKGIGQGAGGLTALPSASAPIAPCAGARPGERSV